MKPKDTGKNKGWTKQQKQFAVLGVLSVVLVGVMLLQFQGSEADYEVAALSQDAVDSASQPQPEESEVPAAPAAQDNRVLSQAPAEVELPRNPFTSFWNRETTDGEQQTSVPPPAVVLGMTIPGGERPVAVIDGELHFVGDTVQGWTLEAVHARAIVLRSPGGEQLVVQMPLFHREVGPSGAESGEPAPL